MYKYSQSCTFVQRYRVQSTTALPCSTSHHALNLTICYSPYDVKNPYLAPVIVNRELHNGGDRSCMHIEVGIEGSKIRYNITGARYILC